MMKIRADMLFLTMADAAKRLVVLTEQDMYERCLEERASGRVPPEIEFLIAAIPSELRARLQKSKAISSAEVKPK